MHSAVIAFLSLILTTNLIAQCPDFQLIDLQSIQRSNDEQKERFILSLGFDLAAKTGNSLRYNKCWNSHVKGKEVYDQVIYWNTVSGNITFLSPDEEAFIGLRKSIEGRHGQTGTLGSSDIYVGQVFRYRYGSRWLDGVMHWSVEISFK